MSESPAEYHVLGGVQGFVEPTCRLKGMACAEEEATRCEVPERLDNPQPQPRQNTSVHWDGPIEPCPGTATDRAAPHRVCGSANNRARDMGVSIDEQQ